MFFKIFKLIKPFLLVTISTKHKDEFVICINRINVTRGKLTAIAFIAIEIIQLVPSFIIKRNNLFKKTDVYYIAMYILLILLMIIYLLTFVKLENNISEHNIMHEV